jgi:putative ATP-binding cassette transporter
METLMRKKKIQINRETWNRFVRCVKEFFTSSQAGLKAKWLGGLLIAFLFGINGLNVLNSYVGRDFMTAIENRNQAEFIFQAVFYISVFAASTLVFSIYRFTEERLGLIWREWATRQAIV